MSLREFQDTILAQGMEPPLDMESGKFYRMPGIDKSAHNRAGYCKLFEGSKSGCFGDWSTGFHTTWLARRQRLLTNSEKAVFSRRVIAAKERAEKSQLIEQAEAARNAKRIYVSSTQPPANSPYLVTKQIKPHNARLAGNRLVVPIMDFSQNLTSVQFIAENGDKRLLTGGRKKGCFIPLNQGSMGTSTVIICEGWATGATLAEDSPTVLVLAAIDAGNLSSVATGAAIKWPNAELIIAADDDRSKARNIGVEKATEAAKLTKAKLALPQWPQGAPIDLSDFNDLSVYLKERAS